MKAPSGDALPAQGAAKVTQMVILHNPNKVGLRHVNTDLTLLVNLEETFLSLCSPKSQSLELKLMSSAVKLISLAPKILYIYCFTVEALQGSTV